MLCESLHDACHVKLRKGKMPGSGSEWQQPSPIFITSIKSDHVPGQATPSHSKSGTRVSMVSMCERSAGT